MRRIILSKIPTLPPDELNKEAALTRTKKWIQRIGELQHKLYAEKKQALLVVLQGMDGSGKDGGVRNVFGGCSPSGIMVYAFKKPTDEELAHDFLWRVHKVVPPRGMMTIFNRSHYEDVIIVRVHELAPKHAWKLRYDHIKDFERLLSESGTIVLKFFLHISRDEQKERLEDRERDAEKAWKLSAGDWKERAFWDDYIRAYEEAITRCTTDLSPWHIIPANRKWFRNVAVADAIVHALSPYRANWEESLSKLAKKKLAELAAIKEPKL